MKCSTHLISEVEESIDSAKKKELERMASSSLDSKAKESLTRVTDHLEEGASAIKTHQKHIKVADHSGYGWIGTIRVIPKQIIARTKRAPERPRKSRSSGTTGDLGVEKQKRASPPTLW